MESIVKANIVARSVSLQPGQQEVELFIGNGFACKAAYIQHQQSYLLKVEGSQLLVVVDGAGSLAVRENGQTADFPLMKGDFMTLANGEYEVINLSPVVLVLGLCASV